MKSGWIVSLLPNDSALKSRSGVRLCFACYAAGVEKNDGIYSITTHVINAHFFADEKAARRAADKWNDPNDKKRGFRAQYHAVARKLERKPK